MSHPTKAVTELQELVDASKTIMILQPEKPDTDSLTTSLALEQIFGDLGKEVIMYCEDAVPNYISYFEGADRVLHDFPKAFDLTIIVDTGGPQSIGRTLEKYQGRLTKKPIAIIDHHPNREPMPFPLLEVIDPTATSTCDLLLAITEQTGWKVNAEAANLMVPGILADTRNLSIATVSARDFETMAKLIHLGADVHKAHEQYRAASKLEPELLELKGRLLMRAEFLADGKIAVVVVTPEELKKYAEIHDPADLVIYELQNAIGVQVGVVIRHYGGQSNKIKVSTRANIPVAAKACQDFGGGGHDRAAGCQINDTPIAEVKANFIKSLTGHISDYEAVQHP